ncbi:MAG: UDP-N-acetylmuramate--L-alanine ligase [Clostridiaceae bacterium]|jgi:UDP-N-acetylmuramate--alanine ligase|nr:UDP-N-acetylmuramate--L-alanine ligase [Clostridiaceae bacterium]
MQIDGLLGAREIKKIHFTGIGGISMSGLAEILANQGYIITGSDIKSSSITQKLEKAGIKVTIGHQAENVTGVDLLVYTAAVKPNNPELVAASEASIPLIDRAALLGEIMTKYPRSIAISGTHGKTTTTSMLSMIMLEEGLDPTIHIGGELTAIGGTTRIGESDYFIAEACEYTGSFLKLHPYLAVILNIEYDHADYFKDLAQVQDSFHRFAQLVPENGWLLVNADNSLAVDIMERVSCNRVTFGIQNNEHDWSASNITYDSMGCASYTLMHQDEPVCEIKLKVPGIHNVSNSLAAIVAGSIMGCSMASAAKALQKFTGTNRRFELKGKIEGITVMDDYAHHPTEVAATLKAAANCHYSRIWCVFQPHTYTRTKCLLDEFSKSFGDANFVILSDIYAAREVDSGEVNSSILAERILGTGKKAFYIKGFDSIVEFLDKNAEPGDLIITMGAGDIYKVGEMFLDARKKLAVS